LTRAEQAKAYAEKARIFPLSPASKVPFPGSAGLKDATHDAEQVAKWWAKHPDANIAYLPPQGELVIDCDLYKPGGQEDFDRLVKELGPLPDTASVRTARGGVQYYFRVPADLNPPAQLAPTIDLKGCDKGYVLLPPSIFEGKQYEWIDARTAATLPATWLAYIKAKSARTAGPIGAPAAPLPEEIREGEGRNVLLTSAAGSMRRRGLSEAAILAALRVDNEARCRPPLPDWELVSIARSIGRKEPGPEAGQVAEQQAEQPARMWLAADLWKAEEVIPPDLYLANQVISRGTVTMIAGRRGTQKTYGTLVLSQRICLGEQFGPLVTRQGRVLYLSQEMSESAIRSRLLKLFTLAELQASGLAMCCRAPGIKLDKDAGADRLRQLIEQQAPDVVFIDALRDIKGTADENSNNDMGDLLVRLRDGVAAPTNTAIVLLHHMGKPNKEREHSGGRGASAIEDTCADVLYITRRGKDAWRTVEFEKTREGDSEGYKLCWQIVRPDPMLPHLELEIREGEPPDEASPVADERVRQGTEYLAARKVLGPVTRVQMQADLGWSEEQMRDAKKAAGRLWHTSGGGRGRPQTVELYSEEDED
jgi:hypothetical protein